MSWTIAPVGRGSNLIYSQAGMPSLDLRFAETKSLNDFISSTNLITFTRASNATFFDSNGLIQTTTTNTPRFDHNPATGESLGLLVEEQRVNLLLNSETLVTQSATVAAAAHTLSFYGTGSVVLSGAHSATVNGTGAYPTRTTLTFTPTAGSLTLTVTGTVQYANLEAGAFATSWIPTTGSTATRSADVASISGSNFSGWFSTNQGTFYSDVAVNAIVAGNSIIGSNVANYNPLFFGAGDVLNCDCRGIGGSLALIRSGLVAGAFRAASAVNTAGNFAGSWNGIVNAESMSAVTLSSVTSLRIGGRATGATTNCRIRRLTYWPVRLENNVLQSITQ
jgi:hypothetical protein